MQGKMHLVARVSELMPGGKPKFEDIRYYPSINALKQQIGPDKLTMALFVLVQDFCRSINVVRNMNEDQMIECASMLLDECDNFRLEDYVMMFTLAKRNQIGNIFDHVDLQVVSKIMDDYWALRDQAGKRLQEQEFKSFDEQVTVSNFEPPEELKGAFRDWMSKLDEQVAQEKRQRDQEQDERRKETIRKFAKFHNLPRDENDDPHPIPDNPQEQTDTPK